MSHCFCCRSNLKLFHECWSAEALDLTGFQLTYTSHLFMDLPRRPSAVQTKKNRSTGENVFFFVSKINNIIESSVSAAASKLLSASWLLLRLISSFLLQIVSRGCVMSFLFYYYFFSQKPLSLHFSLSSHFFPFLFSVFPSICLFPPSLSFPQYLTFSPSLSPSIFLSPFKRCLRAPVQDPYPSCIKCKSLWKWHKCNA